jgi:hypothetical protein
LRKTIKKIPTGKSFKGFILMRNKLVFFTFFILLLGVLYLVYNFLTPLSLYESKLEIVTPEERIVWPLQKNGTIPIHTSYGELTIVVSQGQAYVSESTCPDKTCIKSGKISRNGQIIICAPNRVMLRVIKQNTKSGGAFLSY